VIWIFSKKKILVVDEVLNNIVAIGLTRNGLYYMKLSDLLYLGNNDKVNDMAILKLIRSKFFMNVLVM
jgi:hypothetical protein